MALENPVGAGRLTITFHRCNELRKVEFLGQSPAVRFHLDTQKDVVKGPAHHHGNHEPVWNWSYTYELKGDEHELRLEVVHEALIGHAFIAKAEIPLQTLVANPGETTFKLTFEKDDEQQTGGYIIISNRWEPFGQPAQQQFAPPQQPMFVPPPQPTFVPPPQPAQPMFVPPPQPDSFQAMAQEIALLERVRSGQVHRLALQGSNGRWMHANEHHKVHFASPQPSQTSIWHVQHHEGRVMLRSAHGKFLAAYGDGEVRADRDEHSHNERFLVEELGNGRIALRTHHGTYLGADGEGPVVQRANLGPHEQFFLQIID